MVWTYEPASFSGMPCEYGEPVSYVVSFTRLQTWSAVSCWFIGLSLGYVSPRAGFVSPFQRTLQGPRSIDAFFVALRFPLMVG